MRTQEDRTATQRGFTLVETIAVILVLAVLAVTMLPRLEATRDFDSLAFHDRVLAAVRYAHKLAIARNAAVYVVTADNTLTLCFDARCIAVVSDPAGNRALRLSAPGSVTLSSSVPSFHFDGVGRPSAGSVTFTVGGTPARIFEVEAETGYVHP